MRDRPIIFSGDSVRAILRGEKTQTRRVTRWPEWVKDIDHVVCVLREGRTLGYCADGHLTHSMTRPYEVGQQLWVRETWAQLIWNTLHDGIDTEHNETLYRADERPEDIGTRWRPSIFMPRDLSRLTLEVVSVRVEKLQSISEEDAIAEGVRCWICGGPVDGTSENDCACFHTKHEAPPSFQVLWNTINAKRPGCSWEDNPWVRAVSFRRVG